MEKKKMIKTFTTLLIVIFASLSVFAQTKTPQFKDYPSEKIYKGKNAPVQLKTESERMFRTRLRDAAKQKPNFAGHYVLTAWGCGTTCLQGAIVDVKTGKVSFWDFSLCCWGIEDDNFNPIEFRINSKLIVFSGNRNEKDNDNGAHFYKFENGKFIHIKTIPKKDSY
jgi:hypothetical protein